MSRDGTGEWEEDAKEWGTYWGGCGYQDTSNYATATVHRGGHREQI